MTDWRLITDDSVSASFGLAADDCLANRVGVGESQTTLRLYTYQAHCALVGRFQNLDSEIDRAYCEANGITLNRRPTGGGAIIMGHEQLGIALCIPSVGDDSYKYARELMVKFSAGITHCLNGLGIESSFRGKNDIEVQNRKLVGLGVYRAPSGGLLFHASVLVGLDIGFMLSVLNTPFEKISDKVIATIAERVTTIRREVGSDISLDDVRQKMAEGYQEAFGIELVAGDFDTDERDAIAELEKSKYLTSDWVNQTTAIPDTYGSSKVKTPAGLLDIRATLAGNTIKAVFIGGDFFATEGAIADLEAKLRWHSASTKKVAATIDETYALHQQELNNLPLESLQEAIQQAVRRGKRAESTARADPYGCFVNPQTPEVQQQAEKSS